MHEAKLVTSRYFEYLSPPNWKIVVYLMWMANQWMNADWMLVYRQQPLHEVWSQGRGPPLFTVTLIQMQSDSEKQSNIVNNIGMSNWWHEDMYHSSLLSRSLYSSSLNVVFLKRINYRSLISFKLVTCSLKYRYLI